MGAAAALMQDFHYVRPDEMFTLYGSVSGGAEATYEDEWLVDGRPAWPVRATSGSPSWTITNPSKTCSLIAVCNHNVDPARAITITGSVSTSLTGPALPANRISLNPWVSFAETSVSTLTLSISSNSVPVIIGELIAGKRRTLERSLVKEGHFEPMYAVLRSPAEFKSLQPYDKGFQQRRLRGSLVLTAAGFADVEAWFDSTLGGTKPTLIVPDTSKQDAMLVDIVEFTHTKKAGLHYVSIAFLEYPRSRW